MKEVQHTRRNFLQGAAAATVAGIATASLAEGKKRDFKISVAAWSLHKEIFAGKLKSVDAFKLIREEWDIDGFELVNNLLEVTTADYVNRLRRESEKYKVEIPLIMIDSEGPLGAADPKARERAIRYHAKWIDVASDLGCHSIRVNWGGAAPKTEQDPKLAEELIKRSVGAYQELCEIGKQHGINVIIENHWGPSSYPDILVGLMKAVDRPNFGTLPDFGNFPDDVDKYDAIDKMMPYAKAVSAKCYDFDPDGKETKIDFERMMQICIDKHGYNGFVGIEYEGKNLSERDGIKACRDLLIKLRG